MGQELPRRPPAIGKPRRGKHFLQRCEFESVQSESVTVGELGVRQRAPPESASVLASRWARPGSLPSQEVGLPSWALGQTLRAPPQPSIASPGGQNKSVAARRPVQDTVTESKSAAALCGVRPVRMLRPQG